MLSCCEHSTGSREIPLVENHLASENYKADIYNAIYKNNFKQLILYNQKLQYCTSKGSFYKQETFRFTETSDIKKTGWHIIHVYETI